MKHNRIILAIMLLLPAAPLAAQVQPLPNDVTRFIFEDCKAVIVPDTVTGLEDGLMNAGAGIRVNGSEVTFYDNRNVRLHFCPGTATHFVVTDNANVTFQGTFRFPGTFELWADDASTVTFTGIGDTVSAKSMVITLEDVARVNAKSILRTDRYNFSAKDYSRFKAFIVEQTGSDGERQKSHFTNTNYASYHIGHNLYPGHNETIDLSEAEDFFSYDEDEIDLDDLKDFDADNIADLTRKIRLRLTRRTWNSNIDFSWGFHNWGKDRFNGLAGTDDDAAVRTSFNHIMLTFNYPVLSSRRVALYAGLGMEWDKYKFHRGDIHFDQTTDPYHFIDGFVPNSESRLLTRYVILPIEVKFDLGRHWKLGLAAIPGLHWSGSHTGLRRDITSGDDETNIKDISVNPYINSYKLDARIAVQYRSVGVYFQASMLPAFKGSCEELFPVKFGIIL